MRSIKSLIMKSLVFSSPSLNLLLVTTDYFYYNIHNFVETSQLEITKQKSKESIPQTDDIDTELDANFGKSLIVEINPKISQ